MQILTKADMYELLRAGKFGNTFRTWRSVDEAVAEGYEGPFGLRTSKRSGLSFNSDMTLEQARDCERRLKGMDLYFNEYVPQDCVIINGEVNRAPTMQLRYGMGPQHMRTAMANPQYATGLIATLFLRTTIGYDNLAWLNHLMDIYEGADQSSSAVVEFTYFSVPVGALNQQMVIWEVRSY